MQVAEISREPGRAYEIEMYSVPDGSAWSFDLKELMEMFEEAITELSGSH